MPEAKLPENLDGFCDERFTGVADLLSNQLATGEHHGLAFAAYYRGEPVVDVWGGKRNTPDGEAPWQQDTMAICFSTTKGVAATALHMAMERSSTSYDATVASVWPEFGVSGKEAITIRQALCHEAGIPQIREQVKDCSLLVDWDAMVAHIECLEPIWEPGTANGYHAINFAWLVGELIPRIDGRDVPTFLADELAVPLKLDGFYIGTPASEHHRIAPLIGPERGTSVTDDEAYDTQIPKDTVIWKALAPRGSLIDLFATPEGMSSCIPSISGAFTARSLARMYAALERGGELDGVRILEEKSVETASTVQNDRQDLVIILAPKWRLGYMSGGSAIPVLGPNDDAYGHVGAGGTFAAADPKSGLAFGLVYDRWAATELLGGMRSMAVSNAVVHAATALA
jgi:CubicO group peptidase (beta-lactamase class C family)